MPDLTALTARLDARIAELDAQAAQIRQRAELEVTALLTAAHELRAVRALLDPERTPAERAGVAAYAPEEG